jgi:hypothetical protein
MRRARRRVLSKPMAWTARVLVIANVTATSPELIEALRARAEQGPIAPTLLMPATGIGYHGREEAQGRLDAALGTWRENGIEATGVVGDPDPVVAVHETWNPTAFDEVIVSTLPGGASKWLQFDLPHRVQQITGLDVKHVVARERVQPRTGPPPAPREAGALGPLTLRAPKRH